MLRRHGLQLVQPPAQPRPQDIAIVGLAMLAVGLVAWAVMRQQQAGGSGGSGGGRGGVADAGAGAAPPPPPPCD